MCKRHVSDLQNVHSITIDLCKSTKKTAIFRIDCFRSRHFNKKSRFWSHQGPAYRASATNTKAKSQDMSLAGFPSSFFILPHIVNRV